MATTPAKPMVGGQAVVEGVMMRSAKRAVVVCRAADGTLRTLSRPVAEPTGIRRVPFLRGAFAVTDSLRLGTWALRHSIQLVEKDAPHEPGASILGQLSLSLLWVKLALASWFVSAPEEVGRVDDDGPGPLGKARGPILMMFLVYVLLPQALAEGLCALIAPDLPIASLAYQTITGAVQLTVLVAYLSLLRRSEDVRRLFGYHGAEHKAVAAHEAGQTLSIAGAKPMTRRHARCGTTFLVTIVALSIPSFWAVGMLLPDFSSRASAWLALLALKIPTLVAVASITFELQRWLAARAGSLAFSWLLLPGYALQGVTTLEPDEEQLGVALEALRASLQEPQPAHD